MAETVKLENGYTKIANELLEIIYGTNFNATQLKIILCIIRYTYGFNRSSHNISISFLSKSTATSKRYISTELKRLIDTKVVVLIKGHTDTSSRILKINKEYSQWEGHRITNQQMNDRSTGDELITTTDEQQITTTDELYFIQERKNKEKLKERDSSINFKNVYDYYLTLDLIKHKKYKPEMINAMKKTMKELDCDTEHLKKLLKRHEEKVKATKDSKYPIKIRGITEFFGQKKSNGTQLICSDYDDDVYISNKNEGMDDLDIELKKIMGGD